MNDAHALKGNECVKLAIPDSHHSLLRLRARPNPDLARVGISQTQAPRDE